jgi:hypothetical protein
MLVTRASNTFGRTHPSSHTRPLCAVFHIPSTLSADDDIPKAPSMAQTHFQGPLTFNGSGQSLSSFEMKKIRVELEDIKAKYGLKEPERTFRDEPDTKWRWGGKPDYTLTNLLFLKGRTKEHPEGSLELIVENLIKSWEGERSHVLDCKQHLSVDQEHFRLSANGGKAYNNEEANAMGNYNVLLNSCPAKVYDAKNTTWKQSHDKFHDAFAAFPWEVLAVYSPPPKVVAFTWRHWAQFSGTFEGNFGDDSVVEVFGFCTATVNEKLQLCNVEIFYDAEEFIAVLRARSDAFRGSQEH